MNIHSQLLAILYASFKKPSRLSKLKLRFVTEASCCLRKPLKTGVRSVMMRTAVNSKL